MSSLHQRAKDVFLDALAVPPSERSEFIAVAAGDDAELRREIESLLAFHREETTDPPSQQGLEDGFAAGAVFAGRYRMIARLGRGGMGDVWRAEDLVLSTDVALKLIRGAGHDARERILNEVRVARQITHPGVCRVFDVGEAPGGIVFFSMELVRGEDLAALLRRVGRLPSDRVIEIAHQLCNGLAAAHAQGVLHRDLKPGNVLIDDRGAVRITDFGIALPRVDAAMHHLTGTPGYMAPEQRASGTTLSEQTDVYALGIVLYEMLVGQHPFPSSSQAPPPPPSSVVPHVSPHLERAIVQALAPTPADRPASALELAAMLGDVPTRRGTPATDRGIEIPRTRTRWWLAGAAAAVIVAALALASSSLIPARAGSLTEQDTIVLADFENTTGEPVFDGALKVALAVALEQSPFIRVFPDDRARETLRLMQRSPEERITRTLAREIARREQLKALISGSIASLGRNYVVTLEAINAQTGDVMAREQAEASGKEQVLTSLGSATSKMREKLGESLASIQKYDVSLPKATTQSLDALHAYSLALSEGAEVPRLEAIPHLQRAIELDPTFAMAYAFMSSVYANTGQSAQAPTYSQRAFELRDRVSERERFFISWRYYRDVLQTWDKALDLARSWTATYPREASAFNSLGIAYIRLGRFEDALAPLNEAKRLDPKFTLAYSNLAGTLLSLNRFDEARAVLREAAQRRLDFIGARRLSYLLAFVQGDTATMETELAASVGPGVTNAAFGWQAHTSAFGGRVMAAHEQFARGIQMSLQGRFTEVAAQLTVEDAESHAIVDDCVEARREANAGLTLSRDSGTLERALRTFAQCGAATEVSTLSTEIAKRFPEATVPNRVTVPVSASMIALTRGDASRAIELLEPVRAFDHAPSAEFWPAYVRGEAYLQLKDARHATEEFRTIAEHRGEVPASPLYALAHVGLARAALLSGNIVAARHQYDTFFALWKDADPDLQPLKDARAAAARIGTGGDGQQTSQTARRQP
jgi:serine/threonine protein kinase/Flp pilus assembly protein TadD